MIKRILLFLFLFLFIHSSHAQNLLRRFYIKGTIYGVQPNTLYAFGESSDRKVLLDSVKIEDGKSFDMMVKTRSYPGFIYISSNIEPFEDPLLFYISENCDTIKFVSRGTKFIDSISFLHNPDNTLLYSFLKLRKKYSNKTDKESIKRYDKEILSFKPKTGSNQSVQFLYDYFLLRKNLQQPDPEKNLIKTSLIKINQHIELLNTDILEYIFQKFINMHEQKNAYQTEMEITLQDTFLNLMKSHLFKQALVLKFGNIFVSYLTYNKYYTALGNYISNASYIPTEYEPDRRPKLIPGINIPSIKGLSLQGAPVDINDSGSEYKIIFIWSPECDHCARSMPDMNAIYEERKGSNIQFYGFSTLKLDSTNNSILKWENSAMIYLGWENEFLQTYSINYTPVILLLDKHNNIIDIPEDGNKLRISLLKLQ